MTTLTQSQKKSGSHPRLGEFLSQKGHLSERQINWALEEQKKTGKRLGEILSTLKIVSEDLVAQSLGAIHDIPYVTPHTLTIESDLFLMIPEWLARRHLAVPIRIHEREFVIAMTDPLNYETLNDLRFYAGMAISPVIATRKNILETIEQNYHFDTSSVEKIVQASAKDFEEGTLQVIPDIAEANLLHTDTRALEEKSQLGPVVQLTNVIVGKAIKLRASDIHIEPGQKDFRVRYRIDGLLKEEMRLPKWVQSPLVSRIKILATLDISERRLPQDGAVRVMAEGRAVDLRVSTLPTTHGEKVVLRILDQSKVLIDIDQVGLQDKDAEIVRKMIRKQKGMILVTGPTGSGKTTTLYALIQELKSVTNNLTTVEDPVEYTIDGINQIQINNEVGLTFSSCLRSILRQDPNIIFVGEIRDKETAEIAFRAAMTGHLVLSTLHTNDAPSTITRLVDIGIPPYLISSSLVGVIAQRLVRKRCTRCKELIGEEDTEPDRRRTGCSLCNHTGFSGRVGVFEVMPITPKTRELISSGATDEEIRAASTSVGMTTMEEDALVKARAGMTTLEEVARVVEKEEVFKSTCPTCQRSIRIDFLICPYCAEDSPYVCNACGKLLQPDWTACPYCRHEISQHT
ncbi:MAG: ATPase, T2SS/T4P/T4SS family [Nitrospiria bacterium]